MESLLQDLRYGARLLASKPTFTLVAVLALALGIGANTAIFSIVNSVLLRPLPFKDPDRLITIWERNQVRGQEQSQASPVTFSDWREQSQLFEQVAGWWYPQLNLTEPGAEPERVRTVDVTHEFFSVLGAEPLFGRTFMPGEDLPGAERTVVLGHRLWQRRFNSDPDIISKTVTLDGRSYSVIGIMPKGFDFPEETEVWRPLGWLPTRHSRGARFFEVVARLKPGVSIEQAQAELSAMSGRIASEFPQTNADWGVKLISLHDEIVGNFRSALLVLLGAVGFVLLIACANVANLLLARAATRSKEVAIRTALGAGRLRLVRQFLTESLLLALLGGLLGFALAYVSTRLLVSFSPVNLPRLEEVSLDGRVLGFTLATAILTGIVFGIVPALTASRTDLSRVLKEGGRSSSAGASGRRIRSALVVAEVAIALVLLIGAGLLLKSFIRLQGVDPGFSPDKVLTLNLQLPGTSYTQWPQVSGFYSQLIDRLKTLPGVDSAGVSSFLPLESAWREEFTIEGQAMPPPGEEPRAQYIMVSEEYFRALGVPLLSGRHFTERDNPDSPGVILINSAMARLCWPGEDPIGKRIDMRVNSFGPLGRTLMKSPLFEVIGVVGNVKNSGLSAEVEPAAYFSIRQYPFRSMNVLIRTAGNPTTIAEAARAEVWSLDRNLPVSGITTMGQVISKSVAQPRFNMLLLAIFALMAMLLASLGIYGVMSYSVTQRTHEIGIRLALGARSTDILRLVVRQGLVMAAIGVGAGIIASLVVTRVLQSLLFGVSATDPFIFATVSLLLVAVALAASYIPARKAIRVDPMIALRYE